jgi:hypothetical protein
MHMHCSFISAFFRSNTILHEVLLPVPAFYPHYRANCALFFFALPARASPTQSDHVLTVSLTHRRAHNPHAVLKTTRSLSYHPLLPPCVHSNPYFPLDRRQIMPKWVLEARKSLPLEEQVIPTPAPRVPSPALRASPFRKARGSSVSGR